MAVFMNIKRMREKEANKHNSQTNIISHASDVEDGVKVWTVEIEGETTNIVLYRDKMEVTCNGHVVESKLGETDSGDMTVSFKVANKQAQITSREGSRPDEGLTYVLTIDGLCEPSSELDQGLDERF
ncbi:hypothetical protein BsWGS_09244 [Bradybaena similaris]